MKDIFGQEVFPGDKVAVGMAYNRSSVLRVGEIVSIKETPVQYRDGSTEFKYSIRIRWSHNGDPNRDGRRWGEVKDSTILHESSHRFAKLVRLPPGYAEQFPPDIQ